MDLIAQAAINHLQTVIAGYLPAVSANSISRDLMIIPLQIRPLGIGGYVGMHHDPEGEIFGRFIEAEAEIRVSENSSNLGDINNEISGVTSALLSTDRETLRGHGIFKLDLTSLSPPDSDNRNARVATFALRCEYQQLPTEAGGIIDSVIIKDLLNPTDGSARVIANIAADQLADLPDPLADFLPLTDPGVTASSASASWQVNAGEGRIEQLNNVQGGGLTMAQPHKSGALLLIRPGGIATPLQDIALRLDLRSTSGNGIGAVLRWQDENNYVYFLISQSNNYQIFGKKVAGSWSFLESGGQATLDNIDLSERHKLLVIAYGDQFRVYLNEQEICAGADSTVVSSGEAGLLAHGNNAAFFHDIDLIELGV